MKEWFRLIPRFFRPDVTGGVPSGPWPIDTPESQGMDGNRLRHLRGFDRGVILRHGVEVHTTGNPDEPEDWASCNRTIKNLLWGDYLNLFGWGLLDSPVAALPCPTARNFPGNVLMKHLLSYTSQPPVGEHWAYSCGDHWPWQSAMLGELWGTTVADAFNQRLRPHLGGTTFRAYMDRDDGTLRVDCTPRDMVRIMAVYRSGGIGTGNVAIVESRYIDRSVAGGPDGTGFPFPVEGYQTHLIRNGIAWELALPGVPDGYMARDGSKYADRGHGIVCHIPSLDLLIAVRGSTPEWYLPDICRACVA